MPAKQRVAVCIPSGGTWTAPMAFQTLCLGIASAGVAALVPYAAVGDDTANARNKLVRAALADGAEWLLWIDTDMIFPPDALVRLLSYDLDIVGVDYRLRGPPYKKIGLLVHPDDPKAWRGPPPAPDLVEYAMLGMGVILVRAEVFKTMRSPWFARVWSKEHANADNPDGFATDDVYFCYFARDAGFRVWCDMALTAQVAHVTEAAAPWAMPNEAKDDHLDHPAVAISA